MVAIDIPKGNVEELAACISPLWDGLGQISMGPFVPSLKKTKIAVHASKGVTIQVNLKSIINYVTIHNITIKPHQALLTMIMPGTWQLLVEDCAIAEAVCTLHSMLVLGKELMVGPWLNVFGSSTGHQVYVQNLAATSSCTAIVSFFATKCGMVLNSHFSKLLDSRYAPWMLIEFCVCQWPL